jgi:hypothetical protein
MEAVVHGKLERIEKWASVSFPPKLRRNILAALVGKE